MIETLISYLRPLEEVSAFLVPVAIIIIFLFISFVINFILRKIVHLTSKTETDLDDKIIHSMKGPIRFILALSGVYFAVAYLRPDLMIYGFSLSQVFQIAGILVVAYTFNRISNTFFDWYTTSTEKKKVKIDKGVIAMLKKGASIFIFSMAFLAIVTIFNINITPVLAGLGIGGIAVALAAKDTLAGLLSGIYLAVDRPIKIGDYIEVDNETKGYVTDIGWRTTKIRTLGKNLIIIPNAKLSESVIKNYDSPVQHVSVAVEVGVAYNSDLEKVEKATIKAAKRVIEKNESESIKTVEPVVRFQQFADSSINLKVIIKAKHYAAQFKLRHELIKEIHKTFKKEGIEIPFPQQDVYIKEMKDGK